MSLLVVYLILMITGDVVAFGIGRVIESQWPAASLWAFLAMYFTSLWLAWIVAVWITKPRHQPA